MLSVSAIKSKLEYAAVVWFISLQKILKLERVLSVSNTTIPSMQDLNY